jgi:hypothetical protein
VGPILSWAAFIAGAFVGALGKGLIDWLLALQERANGERVQVGDLGWLKTFREKNEKQRVKAEDDVALPLLCDACGGSGRKPPTTGSPL